MPQLDIFHVALIVDRSVSSPCVAFVSFSKMTESSELKEAAGAEVLDAPQLPHHTTHPGLGAWREKCPFPAPPPNHVKRPGNEVAMGRMECQHKSRQGLENRVKDNNFVFV